MSDASAALYGVRAANGVVVVTTKKGSRNSKNTVSVNRYRFDIIEIHLTKLSSI